MNEVERLVERLKLQPHPEGGFYRETFRSAVRVEREGREYSASTAIYFLLTRDSFSALHRIRADEGWHFHLGAPMELVWLTPSGERGALRLGVDLEAGEVPWANVPAGHWFGSRTTGEFTLVSCTVAPGFEFSEFELGDRAALLSQFPAHAELIRAFTR